ncbi:hypothetical protein CKO23_13435 [Thiocystis violacea]|nr:hypothetical protein [Thiocystis violacea]
MRASFFGVFMTVIASAQWMLSNAALKSRDDAWVAVPARAATDRTSVGPAAADPPGRSAVPAACPARLLSAREVDLLLEFGDAAERAYLYEVLGCASDPALLEAVIAWHLNRDELDEAAHWVAVADAKGLSVRPWQRMRLALHRDDREMVASLLRETGPDLPVGSRIQGLKYLGKNAQALALAREQAATATDPSEREWLQGLARSVAPRATAGVSALDYGPLSIKTLEVSGELPIERVRVGLRLLANALHSSSTDALDLDGVDRETDISVSIARADDGGEFSARAGASVRSDSSVPYGSLKLQRPLRGDLLRNLSLELALNDLSYETALCRVFCTKSHLTAGMAGGISRRDFFNLTLEAARYQTRENEYLATGLKLDGALGYVLLQELPRWDVSLRGAFQDNDLADGLPKSLAQSQSGPLEIEDILPAQYRFLGLGTSVQGGGAAAAPGRLSYAIDAHTGWQWPADEPSYGLRVNLVTSWLSWRDSLAFSLAYANSLAGDMDESFSQVSLTYGYDF